MSSATLSPARLAANRANAQLSTGPTSETGKAHSSLNSLKTGLTGRTVLLPGDDAEAYQAHLAAVSTRFQPVGDDEFALVQSIADTEWRLARIPALEAGIYAVGRLEFAALFADQSDAAIRRHLVDAKIFLAYQRPLNNLSIQEARLRRQREKDTKALRELQEARQHQVPPALSPAPVFGFDFSTDETQPAALSQTEPRPQGSGRADFHPNSQASGLPCPLTAVSKT